MDHLRSFPSEGSPCLRCQHTLKANACRIVEQEGFVEYWCSICEDSLICKVKDPIIVPIAAGTSDFKALRTAKPEVPYVDKTHMIKELLNNGTQALMILRPRRFGKSLNISMLLHFFSVLKKDSFKEVFKDTQILKEVDLVTEYANKYPVIHLNFGRFNPAYCDSKEGVLEFLKQLLLGVIQDYNEHLISLDDDSKKAIDKLKNTLNASIIINGLRKMSKILSRVFKRSCIILIDEYDVPLSQAFNNQTFKILSEYYHPFLKGGLKDNEHLFKGIITGCTKISGQTLFGGLSHFTNYSLLEENSFQMAYGFSEGEVRNLIRKWRQASDVELEIIMKDIKRYYNGYQVLVHGRPLSIYNPMSIIRYLAMGKIEAYWVESGENYFLNAMHNKFPNEALEVAETLKKIKFEQEVDKSLSTVDILEDHKKIWTLLFFSGYITQDLDSEDPPKEGLLRLKVPNEEVSTAYPKMSHKFKLLMTLSFQESICQALRDFDIQTLIQKINHWIEAGETSGYAYSDKLAYKATVRTILRIVAEEEWEIIEDEIRKINNSYRSAIIVVPRTLTIKRAYIFEFKSLPKDKIAQRRNAQTEAYQQIIDTKYWKLIQNKGHEYDIQEIMGVGAVGCDSELSFYQKWVSEYEK